MDIASGFTYRITNAKAPTSYIDVDVSGDLIIGNASHDGASQRWLLVDTGFGWTLQSVGTGKYVGLHGLANIGIDDTLPAVATDEPFRWDIWPDDADWEKYRLFVPGTRYNLDLSNHGNSTPGTPLAIWGRYFGIHQLWIFHKEK